MPVEGFALVKTDHPFLEDFKKLRNSSTKSGWPPSATVVEIRPIWRLHCTVQATDACEIFEVLVNVTAANEDDLKKVFWVLEQNCHVDGYGQ